MQALTKQACQNFARRQRHYMLAYLGIEYAKEGQIEINENGNN